MESLPDKHREVVRLRFFEDASLTEIAAALDLSLGTVKSRLNRGRRKLRDYLIENAELLPARYRLYAKTAGVGGLADLIPSGALDELVLRLLKRGEDSYD